MLRLFKFKGGVKPATSKTQSVSLPIAAAPLPERLFVPLHQSIGGTPRPIVAAGEHVLKGQKIGEADGWISAAVHASTSGRVIDVAMVPQAHPSGLSALSVVIEPDGEDRWIERTPAELDRLSPDEVRQLLQEAGVVGLGGAVFPSHAKLTTQRSQGLEELIINGAECEPFITCDDLLMRERAADIVRGVAIFRDLLQPRRVLIGIEDNKPEAIAAMQAAVAAAGEPFSVVAVPTLYPAGGAKQLIRVLTGKEIPAAQRSTDLGVQCFNVATAYAACRALAHGEPVISRIVTVTGNVEHPRNWEVPLGTPIAAAVAAGGQREGTTGIMMGGPMMGFMVPNEQAPVIKASNCLIAGTAALFPPPRPEMPCIRCGECAKVCPHELQPFELYWWSRASSFGKAQEYALFDCIECGCCSYVCPSHIPLVQYFRYAKSEIWARERDRKNAEGAKTRFEFKTFRDEREKQEKAERLAKAAAAQKAKAAAEAAAQAATGTDAAPSAAEPAATLPAADAEAAKKALIAAAMERARAQREARAAAEATAAPTAEPAAASADSKTATGTPAPAGPTDAPGAPDAAQATGNAAAPEQPTRTD